MIILYDIGLCLFYVGVLLASIFNTKARKWIKGRNRLLKLLSQHFAKGNNKVMWMHCSSLGEFEQGRPILEEFHKQNPQHKILLSFFSPSGYEVQKSYAIADYVTYIPLDTRFNARRFIKIIQPDIVFFVKYDLWHNVLYQAKKQNSKLYLVSAIFNSKQVFFKWYGWLFRNMLLTFNHIFVQNEESVELLKKIGFNNSSNTGDTRIDRVRQISQQVKSYPLIEQFVNSKNCLVCGSTWTKDEELLSKATNHLSDIKLIIAPHQIHEEHITEIETLFENRHTIRYSVVKEESLADYEILIIDTIGMLSSIYHYGKVAYIGGGFIDGIHNILEAVTYGIPVIFGPNYTEFIEAKDLIDLGGAISIRNEKDLQYILEKWFTDEASRNTAGCICKAYVWDKPSATEKILKNNFI